MGQRTEEHHDYFAFYSSQMHVYHLKSATVWDFKNENIKIV